MLLPVILPAVVAAIAVGTILWWVSAPVLGWIGDHWA